MQHIFLNFGFSICAGFVKCNVRLWHTRATPGSARKSYEPEELIIMRGLKDIYQPKQSNLCVERGLRDLKVESVSRSVNIAPIF